MYAGETGSRAVGTLPFFSVSGTDHTAVSEEAGTTPRSISPAKVRETWRRDARGAWQGTPLCLRLRHHGWLSSWPQPVPCRVAFGLGWSGW
ncbi:hypothetical protein SSAG_00893 [Streptomyces sp. Mg1]|nr:hypothetical protein SSAG_00893 [Streptomyces sp. Mg1]